MDTTVLEYPTRHGHTITVTADPNDDRRPYRWTCTAGHAGREAYASLPFARDDAKDHAETCRQVPTPAEAATLALTPEFTTRITNHLARLGWEALATSDYIEVRIPIEASGQQAAAKRGDRLYVWPAREGMRWEIRPPGAPQGVGEEVELHGPQHQWLVAEIDHLLHPFH